MSNETEELEEDDPFAKDAYEETDRLEQEILDEAEREAEEETT